ncbi:hypothetical protein [Sinomicrobium soli]|uniref:hypothetical protein n=1 Tax=Sinomicrobium sp. N-1-3-6 TaxID=2219864 RepID=UPI000DCBB182|nr:hypothetical protein [Sinomicrobium sp. N-1-3-6]RAV27884.1 hypothetical protein DN748_16625 [Sinomicrobium sp. N-1-3-6]
MIQDDLKKLHYQVLKPSLEQAKSRARPMLRSCSPGTLDPFPVLTSLFREQLVMRKHDIAAITESIDCQNQGYTLDDLDHYIMESGSCGPANPFQNYVRPADFGKSGYKVFDGSTWVELSEEATIHMDDGYGQAVRVYATDPKTGYRLRIFDDPSTPGIERTESTYGIFPDEMEDGFGTGTPEPENRFAYWEDPCFQSSKTGIGYLGIVAGALEYRQVGQLLPGVSLENNMGWYLNKKGITRSLSAQRTGPGPGLHKIGAKNAYIRAKPFRILGRATVVVSVGFSAYEGTEAIVNKDSNWRRVAAKSVIDISIAVVGVSTGFVGWTVSTLYFIEDPLSDWGRPSGYTHEELRHHKLLRQNGQLMNHDEWNQHLKEAPVIEFKIKLPKTSRQELLENTLERRQDNTELRIPHPIKNIMIH